MIPKIIHYCWFGGNSKPELVERCLASWHRFMPDWTYMEWSEANFDIASAPLYVRQAYEARKYAFVSDYVRLWALEQYGGLYMDVDFEVYKSFDVKCQLDDGTWDAPMDHQAFVGREGSKHQPPMLGVMASVPHSPWVTTMLHMYDDREFVIRESNSVRKIYTRGQTGLPPCANFANSTQNQNHSTQNQNNCNQKAADIYDLTTNVSYFAAAGVHRPEWVHIYPVEYFCPVLTTGEDVRSRSEEIRQRNYCEHKGLHSWSGNGGWKQKLLSLVSPQMKTILIKLKRLLIG